MRPLAHPPRQLDAEGGQLPEAHERLCSDGPTFLVSLFLYVWKYTLQMILCIHNIYDGTHYQHQKILVLNILLGEI